MIAPATDWTEKKYGLLPRSLIIIIVTIISYAICHLGSRHVVVIVTLMRPCARPSPKWLTYSVCYVFCVA